MKALDQHLPHLSQARPSSFWLKPIAPFLLEHTVWTLRRRASNLIDRWDGHTYQRVLLIGGKSIEVAVTQAGTSDTQRLQVTLTGNWISAAERAAVRKTLERLLGLRFDLGPFYQLAAPDDELGLLVERFRGVKSPRLPTLFETLAFSF